MPSYPSATTGMTLLPPHQTFDRMTHSRPRWGLRFLFLLVMVGALTYFARPFVPWIDEHIAQIETTVQTLGRQYGFLQGTPAPLQAPTGAAPAELAAAALPATTGVALARVPQGSRGASGGSASGALGRPEIEPMTAPAGRAAAVAAAQTQRAAVAAGRSASTLKANPAATARGARRRAVASARYRRRVAAARTSLPAVAVAPAAAPSETPVETPAPPSEPEPAAAAPVVAAPAPAAPAPSASAGGGDDLDKLMASATSNTLSAPNAAAKSESDLDRKLATVQKGPDRSATPAHKAAAVEAAGTPQLSRSDIQTVMKDVQNAMGDCYAKTGKGGPVDLKIDVAPDGEVRSAAIRGPFAGTPTGACVESKVKASIFPESAGLRFDYRLMVR